MPELEPGVKEENDNIPQISKMQIDLMVNSFAADFARVATLQYTNSVGEARMRWLGVDEGHHELSHEPDSEREVAGEADEDQQVVLRAARLPGQAAGRDARAGRRRAACSTTRCIVWTNELGKGNSHTLDNIPFVLVGNGLDFKMGRSLKFQRVPHNRLLLSLAHGFGHQIERFGNPDFCGDGPLLPADLIEAGPIRFPSPPGEGAQGADEGLRFEIDLARRPGSCGGRVTLIRPSRPPSPGGEGEELHRPANAASGRWPR